MPNDNKKNSGDDRPLARPSTFDLRGRQSVRATFKLSQKAIEAISVVATHLNIKQKSLFDHLIEDARSLNVIAREVQSERFYKTARVQKTYVLSRKTLSSLDEVSKNYDTPRDALVEYSVQRLLPVIEEERERHRRRKEILDEITEYLEQGKKILRKSEELLGEEDPVHDKFMNAMKVSQSAWASIDSFVKRGDIIEEF